jgi:hypothetical protein
MSFNFFISKSFFASILFFAVINFSLNAQTIKTIENLKYKAVSDKCYLDKIVFNEDATVFHFRYIFNTDIDDFHIIFYPPGSNFSWYIRGDKKVMYKCKAVKNIKREAVIICEELLKPLKFESKDEKGGLVTFTCEIYFAPLKPTEKKVHLIEGIGQKRNKNHFNFLNIVLAN